MLMTAKGMFSRIRTSTPQRIVYATDKTFGPDSTEPGKINFQGVRSLASRPLVSRDSEAEALQAKVLTKDEARRIAVNVARWEGR
jgi:hypothetical protein